MPSSGVSPLNEDQIADRGARLARRDDREYREYLREEQRGQPGCPARAVVLDQRTHATRQRSTADDPERHGTPGNPGVRSRLALVLAMACLSLTVVRLAAAEIIDRVAAVVDAQVITLSDVTAALRFGFVQPQAGADPIRSALDQLVERQLMLAEVERYGPPEPSPAAIDEAVAAVRARFGSPSQLATALAQSGLADDQLRRRMRDDLRIRSYLDQRFASAGQAADPERRESLIREWMAGLRRRADVTILYEPPDSR